MSGKGGEVPEGEAGEKVRLIDQQRLRRGERVAAPREKTAERVKEGLRAQGEGRPRGRVSPQRRGTHSRARWVRPHLL